jgi:hypothetical protein
MAARVLGGCKKIGELASTIKCDKGTDDVLLSIIKYCTGSLLTECKTLLIDCRHVSNST